MAKNRLNSGYLGADQRHEKSGVVSHKKLWLENLSNSFLVDSKGAFNKDTVADMGLWLNERSISNKLKDGDNLYNFKNLADLTQDVDWITDGSGGPFAEGDTLTVGVENRKRFFNINNLNSASFMGRFSFPFQADGNKNTIFFVMKRGPHALSSRMSICISNRLAFWGSNQFGTIQEGAGWTTDLVTLPFDPESDYHIYTFRRRGASDRQHPDFSDFWVDGDAGLPRAGGDTKSRFPLNINKLEFGGGSGSGAYGYPPNFSTKEVIAFKRDLSLSEIQEVHNYLSKKHNITLNG